MNPRQHKLTVHLRNMYINPPPPSLPHMCLLPPDFLVNYKMPSPPTIIFVHGAWHTAETWNKVIPRLEAQNYRCAAVRLASTLGNPAATLGDDVAVLQTAIREHTSQGRNVLLVAHSYGGGVASSAVRGFTKPAGEAPDSGTGHVVGLVLITTVFIPTGQHFSATIAGSDVNKGDVGVDFANGWCTIEGDPRQIFYSDLPADEAGQWAVKLQPQAVAALIDAENSYAGWKDVPVWYIAAEKDGIMSFEYQKRWYQGAIAEGADVTVLELDSSHSPMLSMPTETTNFIQQAILALS